mmetsp:Transcript_17131/g.34751  ORF Transcript_17131/g.34751 Transcript_17131/m.34751 type:complete len:259 (+) Transcript_17131:539-1315(+)
MDPKIWLIEATDGRVTFITWKCRLARLGMSFLPPPGCSMALKKRRSITFFHSPALSRLYTPLYSMSCRMISRVIWSPQVLISGIETSSMKTTIFLPPGGPKVRPCRFSTHPSMVRWKMMGVVADEKDSFLMAVVEGSCLPSTDRMILVLAVPGPPTRSTGRPLATESSILYSLRTESMVGMRRVANSALRSCPLKAQPGILLPQCTHSYAALSELIMNSKTVSGAVASGRLGVRSLSIRSTLARSSASRTAASDHSVA